MIVVVSQCTARCCYAVDRQSKLLDGDNNFLKRLNPCILNDDGHF